MQLSQNYLVDNLLCVVFTILGNLINARLYQEGPFISHININTK